MKVLVAYGKQVRIDQGIAERIAECLRVVVASRSKRGRCRPSMTWAATTRLWLGARSSPATGWPRPPRSSDDTGAVLADRPVWLFSSGPIGTMAAKHEPVEPKGIGALVRAIGPREHRVFFGAWDRAKLDGAKLGFAERMVARWPPEGDFRDWVIEAWAESIARALQDSPTAAR